MESMENKTDRIVIKKLTLQRESLRVLVHTGIRAGTGSILQSIGMHSVRQGTLSETGMGEPTKSVP
jgi:hypothetical protein